MMILLKNLFMNLPVPSNISYAWNFGSLLLVNLIFQIITGVFLAMHYNSDSMTAFSSIAHIMLDVNGGWLMRYLHMNGASTFFIFIYLHMGRSLFFGLYRSSKVWFSGMLILFILFAIAFVGYVLPWGQMSFWGATVITSLLSTIPYVGDEVVSWVWGGFAVGSATLSRFFTFHFILPFILLAMVVIHLLFLHEWGSSNPLGVMNKVDKVSFHPYFSVKDLITLVIFIYLMIYIAMIYPLSLNDPENFIPANPLSTPVHIKPEWYYLFAYAILRSIPSKVGGALALVASISIFGILPLVDKSDFSGVSFYPLMKFVYWMFISVLFMLTWIGGNSVEEPFIIIGQLLTFFFFFFFLILPSMKVSLDKF